ncbi:MULTISPECIES: response regulator transcription factor [Pseudomonas]|jgi:Response regulator|uniref:Putative two-component response regulator n=2 Tax=Pseudomonas TaxID=286 RepID=F2KH71_PSEBN|nr:MULTISPECIES: response regulator transcription factor [Pseudomonas]EIK64285.1 DNA-binding response regulator, LuxR family [Pseudomonas fluorescens Q8r1-96]AEA68920.1 putative two-component response regulator [Pseudomonas brassicacearum subsp. brassicacearum NFM421]AOS37773.1 DNA-binding response regulator [Pseudomonas brassicacearum]KAB0527945.1 response regulator transcription factor [Pseudomonas brassicacearum subsp. brassicacearum]NJP59859.1 response regulator transcription factor [Pseud
MNGNSPSNDPSSKDSIVFVVDDDASMRDALSNLLRSVGIRVETFASTADFLQQPKTEGASCLVLDVRLQGSSGLDFQRQLAGSNVTIPIIFITGHGDIEMSVKAMKAGAVDFLAKPFREQDLLDAVSAALQADVKRRAVERQLADLHARYETLTAREKEVMTFAAKGLMNKQIAGQMNLSEITVKIHRGHAMKKMHAKSFADLVRMAESLGAGQDY